MCLCCCVGELVLGNPTLLESAKNKQVAAKPMDEKVQVYAESQYAITRDITATEWTLRKTQERQERLAKVASSVWKL